MPPNENNSHYEKILATGEVKCIDDEIPFEIPKSWEWCRLGQILTVKGGKRIPVGCSFAPSVTSHIYIRVTEMKNNTLIDKDLKYINEDVFEKIKNYTIGKDDLYLTIAGTIGSVGVVPEKFDGMNLTENAVKLTNLMTNKMFLLYVISSTLVQSQFIDKTKQVAQPKLAIERIQTTLIPFPPLDEQEKIVTKIEELLRIIEHYNLAQTQLNTLNSEINNLLKKSILQEAIQGRLVPQIDSEESATVLLEKIKKEKSRLVKEGKLKKKDLTDSTIFKGDDNKYYEQIGNKKICIDTEIPFEIPSSWCWSRLENLIAILDGYRKPISKTERKNGIYPYYGANGILDYIDGYIFEGEYILVGEDGSVVTPYGNPVVNKASGKIWVNNHAHVLQECGELGYYDYLYYALSTIKITQYIHGFMPKYSQGDLRKTLIPIPPLAEQHRIVVKIEESCCNL